MQAFPFQHKDPTTGLTNISVGMTMRDYFAAKAMQGYCSDQQHVRNCTIQMTAESAYDVADAMLKAREVKYD
jgi:hypothetical protein